MKFHEPIIRECPHCGIELQFTLDWILQEGQTCHACQKNLTALRLPIRNFIDETLEALRIVDNILETETAIENKFSICLAGEDLPKIESEVTVSDLAETAGRLLWEKESGINQEELTEQILNVVRTVFPNESFVIKPETKFSELGRIGGDKIEIIKN